MTPPRVVIVAHSGQGETTRRDLPDGWPVPRSGDVYVDGLSREHIVGRVRWYPDGARDAGDYTQPMVEVQAWVVS